MNKFLALGVLVNVASAVNVVVTTICTTATYPTGTLNPLIDSAYSSVTSAGSTVSRIFALASPGTLLYPALFTDYKSALLSFQSSISSATTLSTADIAEIRSIEAQLANVLYKWANSYGALMSLYGFVNAVDTLTYIANTENAAINSLIQAGSIACDQQDSLYSAASSLSNSFGLVSAKGWYQTYKSASVAFTGITTKACTADCTTLTMIATDTTTSSTDMSNGEITSSRTVSGSVQRCLVRATSTTSTTVTPI